MRGESETTWRLETKAPPRYLVLAIAVMAVIGFGLGGAAMLARDVAGTLSSTVGSTHVGGPAQPISAQLASQLHGFGKVKKTNSGNWAGYADTASKPNETILVQAEWFVPSISCGVYPAVQDNWVGIDGFNSGTVEQGGTYGFCNSTGAGPFYWTWFEFYPYEDIQSVAGVSAGDLIQATVMYNPSTCYGGTCGIYTIIVTDLDNSAASFTVVGNPTVCNSSGCEGGPDDGSECISESLTNQGYYLPDYGTSKFYRCDTEINGYYNGIGGLPSGAHVTTYAITTIGVISGLKQQTVSKLSTYFGKDSTFTVTWKSYD
jgi:hypothetical protein